MTFAFACSGAVIQKGATVQVRANSIWFQDASALAHWQALKRSGKAKALSAYQEKMLSQRDAWQFVNKLTVKVLSYNSGKHQINVQMTDPGRMLGTKWWLDTGALL